MKLGNFLRILALSLALSAYSSWLLSSRPATSSGSSPTESIPSAGIPLIGVAEAEALWRQGATLFVDVRSSADHAYGYIPGSLLLPEEEIEERLPALKPRLQRARAIVVYCSSKDCGKSLWTALRFRNEGIEQVKIFPGGWNEWYLRGLPVHRTATR